jgi:hypothetical protein
LHRTVTPMTGASGMVYLQISARWNISHASVQVLGGTSQNGRARRAVPSQQAGGDQMAGKKSSRAGWGPALFFAQRSSFRSALPFGSKFLQRLYGIALANAVGGNKLSASLRPRLKELQSYPGGVMRYYILIGVAMALAGSADRAQAAIIYPWCAHYMMPNGPSNCGFATFEQCA